MAKRLVKWELNESVLKMIRIIGEGEKAVDLPAKFDLIKLFPDFKEYSDVQKQLVVYGVKQKLSDSGANEVANFGGKIKNAKDKWQELLDGKWKGARVNATGAAEAKKFTADIRQKAQVVSLEGLMIKKISQGQPGIEAFTEEDEKKLNEFMAVAVKATIEANVKAKN